MDGRGPWCSGSRCRSVTPELAGPPPYSVLNYGILPPNLNNKWMTAMIG